MDLCVYPFVTPIDEKFPPLKNDDFYFAFLVYL